MKNLFLSFTILCFVGVKAQTVTDYQYIFVPKEFKDFPANKYNLKFHLIKGLQSKNYTVIDQAESLPVELQQNPCSFLTAEVENNSSMIRNRVLVKFKDCKNTVVSELKGTSMEKEFEIGYSDALNKALAELPISSPKELPESNPTTNVSKNDTQVKKAIVNEVQKNVELPKTKVNTTTQKSTLEKSSNSAVQNYNNGKITLQKVQIGSDQFILVSSESPVPYATFKSTAKPDVFRVNLNNGISTLGYLENNNLIIEIPNGEEFIKEVFIKQ